MCYPWKVLAAIQASFPCSHPFSSLTGELGSKNSCQEGFNVIDKPFVSTEALPLASPNKTAQNLRISGKTCWAACGIKQQEVSESVTVTVHFYKWLCNPRRKSPEGLEVEVLIPSPTAPPPPPASSRCSSSPSYNSALPELAFPSFSLDLVFFFFSVLALGTASCFLWGLLHFKHASWTAGGREAVSSPLPISPLLDRQHEHSWRKVWSQV